MLLLLLQLRLCIIPDDGAIHLSSLTVNYSIETSYFKDVLHWIQMLVNNGMATIPMQQERDIFKYFLINIYDYYTP